MKEIDTDDLIAELKDLRIRVARLETQQTEQQTRQTRQEHERAHPTVKNKIQVGDQIKIKNKIKKPSNWPTDKQWTEPLERLAVVTRITTDRVYFTTRNGTLTWRHPQNIQKI